MFVFEKIILQNFLWAAYTIVPNIRNQNYFESIYNTDISLLICKSKCMFLDQRTSKTILGIAFLN